MAIASTLPISRLPAHLKSFPQRWPFPKGDLYHWIPLFNRFDHILDIFSTEYGLREGPQRRPFGRSLLLRGVSEESNNETSTTSDVDLDSLGYSSDGDRHLVEVVLEFSRRLLENCGNRSLYNSSERLDDLLNTTCLSLLTTTLQLAVRLAQRYHASRQRGANASQHMNSALLASHYSIDLEKVQKLANPFVKSPISSMTSKSAKTPTNKGKEKVQTMSPTSSTTINPNDLLAFTSRFEVPANGSAKHSPISDHRDVSKSTWQEWGSVLVTYYQSSTEPSEEHKPPSTPTPTRRLSGLSRPSRLSNSEESPELTSTVSDTTHTRLDDSTGAAGLRRIEVPYQKLASSTLEDILQASTDSVPKDSQYELLTKLRNAHAITNSPSTRQELIGIRLLAITNLAYIYPETMFQQKILQQDSEEPRRFQLTYQLADLVHPPGNGALGIPPKLQTLALGTLEAFSKQKTKAPDVCAALNVNVNHGVLFYILHKAVTVMATDEVDGEDEQSEIEERLEALFSLLEALPTSTPRTGETLVAAGLLEILIEVLNLRTKRAERAHPKVLAFLSTFLYTVRDAMQALANSKGLDAISDLLNYEVQSSLDRSRQGEGLPEGFKTRSIDYRIPYFQQQSLRVVFKLIAHMMTHGGGNLDRLLRNLIDSPQLLSGLHTVIVNAPVFGSAVWSGAINIMSVFIHNEPTSYAVISEAGLSKGLLETVALHSGPAHPTEVYLDFTGDTDVSGPGFMNANANNIARFMNDEQSRSKRHVKFAPVQGILPNSDAILGVPQAFGAICLNHSGMQLFLESGALDSFFKIFESDEHVRSLSPSTPEKEDLPRLLGSSFDELVRHHPNLKMPVMIAIMTMIERVGRLSRLQGRAEGCGAKLWLQGQNEELITAGEDAFSGRDSIEDQDGNDMVMSEAPPLETETPRPGSSLAQRSPQKMVENREEKSFVSTATRIEVTMNFLAGFFENSTLCAFFVEASGANYVLDLATLPSLQYDFNVHNSSVQLARVIHMMVEQKPHLVLPSLLRRTQEVADTLKPFYEYTGEQSFFAEFTSPAVSSSDGSDTQSHAAIGTTVVKSLVNVQTLCNILFEVFSNPIFSSRSGHTPFSQVNLADKYRELIKSLGLLHRICVWEEILLQKNLPESWKEPTKFRGLGMGSDEADEVLGMSSGDGEVSDASIGAPRSLNVEPSMTSNQSPASPPISAKGSAPISIAKDEKTAYFKNTKVLRHLLSQVPSLVVLFYQNLGKALVPKRRPEAYARQNAYIVAEAMSDANLEQLSYDPPRRTASVKDRYAYWIVALTSLSSLMIEGMLHSDITSTFVLTLFAGSHMDRASPQVLTLLLQAFKNDGGLDAVKEILRVFYEEVNSPSTQPEISDEGDAMARKLSASGGIKIILAFFTQITQAKSIVDSSQTQAITSNERDRGQSNYFSPPQFLVELRMTVLPIVRTIWDSEFVDKATSSLVKCLIDILRTVLEGGEEQGAFKRGEEQPTPKKASFRIYSIQRDKVDHLVAQGYGTDIAREALYRCLNVQAPSLEYCQALQVFPGASRNPIPDYDQEKASPSTAQALDRRESETTLSDSDSVAPPVDNAAPNPLGGFNSEMVNAILAQNIPSIPSNAQGDAPEPATPHHDTQPPENVGVREALEGSDTLAESAGIANMPPPSVPGVSPEADGVAGDQMAMSIDNLQDIIRGMGRPLTQDQTYQSHRVSNGPTPPKDPASHKAVITVDDLDAERTNVRGNLIDRALDVLNIHGDVTFELADLINAAALKSGDAKIMRKEIGETLVQSLISLQNDDFRPVGKKIASYANLLALVLQDRDFYEATSEQLTEYFGQFLGFIKIHPDHPTDEPCPWVGQILLIVEKMLAEDVQPSQIRWDVPTDGKPPGPLVNIDPPLVPVEQKIHLFEAICDILLRVGKDESLALSVVRTLVILTRNQEIASKLSEKQNIQKLFIMIKQLAGIVNDKLPSTFMLLLRHIVEDEDTIRRIMGSEILSRFEARPGRASSTDTTGYVKQMYELVIRSPEIFIEVTNEKLEIPRYDGNGANPRPQILQLKAEPQQDKPGTESIAAQDATVDPSVNSSGQGEAAEETKSPADEIPQSAAQKSKQPEIKAPVVEHPSGVIHYLLHELLAYKDVEDRDSTTVAKGNVTESANESWASPGTTNDATVVNPDTNLTQGSSTPSDNKKVEKPEFKPSEHPIHMYRNFILQCLAELLHCYNRTKIEFINFSRKTDPKAMTPSKPRSGVLNYLLTDVIPVGTLGHEETIAYRKKNSTSNWAMSAIVSLCLRTNESGHHKKQGSVEEDDETDLLFVRKFVLEHALKAFKDANTLDEHPDIKYARLLDLADLFNRLLHGRLLPFNNTPTPGLEGAFQKSIAKLMFEKNFIAALTGSIADIDLNFPGSKRAIKYILRPLKQLTATAIVLSQTSDISTTPGQTTDDDEISTATSVSEPEHDREETPDFFRNSSLGMFEPGREEESSSESSNGDEEMYEDDDEDIGYEDAMDRIDDEVISDEDEDLGEAGHMEGLPGDTGMDVEVVIDGDDEPTDEDDDEDQQDSEDMDEDDDHEIEVIDEVAGDSENGSLAEGDEDGWQDEDGEDIEHFHEQDPLGDHHFGHDQETESAVRDIVREFGGAEAALQRLEGLDDEQAEGLDRLQMDIESGRYMDDVVHHDDDEGKLQHSRCN